MVKPETKDQGSYTNWYTPRGGMNRCYANQMQAKNYLWWMMQTGHSKQELKPNFSWRALEFLFLIPLDYELRCSIAFLLRWVKTDNESDEWNESNDSMQDEQPHKYG